MILILLLIVVLGLILISVYCEVKVNKMVDDELEKINGELDDLKDINKFNEVRLRACEKELDLLKAALTGEEESDV